MVSRYGTTARIGVAGGVRPLMAPVLQGSEVKGFPCRPSIPSEEDFLNVNSGFVGLLSTGGLGVTTPDALAGETTVLYDTIL